MRAANIEQALVQHTNWDGRVLLGEFVGCRSGSPDNSNYMTFTLSGSHRSLDSSFAVLLLCGPCLLKGLLCEQPRRSDRKLAEFQPAHPYTNSWVIGSGGSTQKLNAAVFRTPC